VLPKLTSTSVAVSTALVAGPEISGDPTEHTTDTAGQTLATFSIFNLVSDSSSPHAAVTQHCLYPVARPQLLTRLERWVFNLLGYEQIGGQFGIC
jgi:hypothetical protein